MAELEQQAASPLIQRPCSTCRWLSGTHRCVQPLIKGFDADTPTNIDWQLEHGHFPSHVYTVTALCGSEKALWEPVPPDEPEYNYGWWIVAGLMLGCIVCVIV